MQKSRLQILSRLMLLAILAGCFMLALNPMSALAADSIGTPAPASSSGGIGDYLTAAVYAGLARFFGWAALGINVIFQYIGQQLFVLGGFLIDSGLKLNAGIITSPVVQNGWLISRNIANLGIVLGLIFIAFSTILRIESFGIKRLLFTLVPVALLINFSLIIPGIFIDATGVITNFFNQKISGQDISKFTEVLASATQIQKLQDVKISDLSSTNPQDVQKITELSDNLISVITQLFFTVLFVFFAAIVFLATAVMLFYRFIALTILLILGPMAAALYIFPKFQSQFSRWWGEILKWSFFLPALMFFLYLTVLTTTSGTNNFIDNAFSPNQGIGGSFTLLFSQIGKMIAVLGLMTGGLYAAKELGIRGAEFGLALAGGVQKYALGLVTGAPAIAGAGAAAGGAYLSRRVLRMGQTINPDGTVTGGVGNTIARYAAAAGFTGIATGTRNLMLAQKEPVEKIIKERSNWNRDMVIANAKRIESFVRGPLPYSEEREEEMAAAGALLAKFGATKEVSDETFEKFMDAARRTGTAKDLLQSRPDLAASVAEKEKIINKMSIADILQKMEVDALENPVVSALLKEAHIEAIAGNQLSSAKHRDAFIKGQEKRLARIKEIEEKLTSLGAAQLAEAEKELAVLRGKKTDEGEYQHIAFLIKNPALRQHIKEDSNLKEFVGAGLEREFRRKKLEVGMRLRDKRDNTLEVASIDQDKKTVTISPLGGKGAADAEARTLTLEQFIDANFKNVKRRKNT